MGAQQGYAGAQGYGQYGAQGYGQFYQQASRAAFPLLLCAVAASCTCVLLAVCHLAAGMLPRAPMLASLPGHCLCILLHDL